MFPLRQRRPLTQADIDRSISLQSSQIRRDFNDRLSGQENEMKTMIESLIKLKMNKTKTPRKVSDSGPNQLKTLIDSEKNISVEDLLMPKTTEIGVTATSKDIDCTFKGIIKYSSGDQLTKQNEKIDPVVKSKQRKIITRELQKGKYPRPLSQHDDHHQIKTRMLRDPKIMPKQVTLSNRLIAPKRQLNFDNELISTKTSMRQRITNTKSLNVDRAKSQKVINKKIR
ncbi:unnamed protein product [Arctia plantaginis]|uniref:Uncharacterized protein n=1 Tax=Arctia plantaginis TaxID=874455 RepID=A0A8S1BLL8_ARCPL|nr:unnamed protein product [Arctia plantaginis]